MTRGSTRVVERWGATERNEMAGLSVTTVDGAEREYERLRLFLRGDTLIYEADPSGQRKTEFAARTRNDGELVFTNPAHDFPQQISYRRVSADSILARIEGDKAGRRQPSTFAYRRIQCPAVLEPPSLIARAALQPRYDDLVEREKKYGGATNGWLAEHAASDFRYVIWASAGALPPTTSAPLLARADSSMRANPNAAPRTNRTFSATLDQLLVRGDTVEALVTTRSAWSFVDATGVYGDRGASRERDGAQRRIDTWVRSGGMWRLRSAELISDDIYIDKRLYSSNGRRVP